MAVEFELPVLQISMSVVDKMHGPDALRALWTVFTKTTGALQDGTRLENMTWRLWHRQLLLGRPLVDAPVEIHPLDQRPADELVSEDDDSGGEWEDDSAPPSRDPAIQPTCADKPGVSGRRQSSTTTLQRPVPVSPLRSRRLSCDPPVLSASQPAPSSRPALTAESRSNSSPESTYSSHGTNIGRIISHLLPEKFDVTVSSSSTSHPPVLVTAEGDPVPSTPKTQPVQLLIHSPSTLPDASDDQLAYPPTLMVITPTPRPTPPHTPSTRARAVPTNIPATLLPSVTPLALNAPSTLDHPHSILLPSPSASEQLVPAAALSLTPTLISAPDLADEDSKKKIFYVQSPEGATASDGGRSHSSSSNSNTTSNVTDPHAALGGQQSSSLSSTTTNEPVSAHALPEAASQAAQDVSGPRGTNHGRTSSGNAAYTRNRAAKGVKATKPAARVAHRGRPNALTRTTSNSSDKSRGGAGKAKPTRQQSVSKDVVEDIEETDAENKQTSASTSHTVTSLPRAPVAPSLSMTPAARSPEQLRNNTPSRVVSSPAVMRQSLSSVRSPPNVLAPAALVAPFTTITSAAPTAPTPHNAQPPSAIARPQANNNSSALMGLGRRAVRVETSSDLDLGSDSEELWSDDETDSEGQLARAANEASRQRSMFEKVSPRPLPRQVQRTGLLTNLMNPDPRIYPHAAFRQHNSAQNLAAGRRGPNMLQTSRSTVAVPMPATVTAEQVVTHVGVDPKGRAVGTSESRGSRGSRGLRLQGRPKGELEDEGSTDEENSIPNELSKTYAQQKLEALATRTRAPPPPTMEQVRHGRADASTPALAPRPAPQPPQATVPYDMDVRPIHSPRTVRRKMIAGELSESLRRNLMWERTSTRFAMGAGALGSGLRPLTETRPGVQTINSDRGPSGDSRSGDEGSQQRSEARRLALARNKSWANDFHHAGW